ncbi:MAG: hypothetical protein WDW36_009904 [Sanguina aurantia]
MSTPTVLCVLGSGPLPGLTLQTLMSTENVLLQTVVFLSEGQLSTSLRFSHALLCTSMPASREVLAKIQKLLQPGARMVVLEDNNPSTQVQCSTPAWVMGAKAALGLRRPAAATPAAAAAAAAAPVVKLWSVAAGSDDDDGDMMDDEDLLTEEDKKRPTVPSADDCEVGAAGRKACANCSCGRAEAEAAGVKVDLTQDMLDNPVSACGSCSLGDAFRCASCPYRGLPKFEAGKKITLSAAFLTADA